METLTSEINKLYGRQAPSREKLEFVVIQSGFKAIYRWIGDNIIQEVVESMIGFPVYDLGEILDDTEYNKLPTEIGIYSADILIQGSVCNHPEDPTEYDMNIWLENIKKIELNYD